MNKFIKIANLITYFVLITVLIAACGPPESITETITEAEFQREEFLCQDYALTVDLQPGKLVCNGYLEGDQVVIELIPKVEAGMAHFQILRLTIQGEEKPLDDFAELNAELAKDTYSAEEGYSISSIVITDNDLTITSNLK